MALKMSGQVVVDAPRDQVWELLFEPQVLQATGNKIPGITVERLERTAEDRYEAVATLGVAMIKGKYDGVITIVEKRAPEYVRFRGDGKSGANWTSGEMSLTLADEDGKTRMTYEGTGNVGGTLASVGQRLADTVGKHFMQYGTRALAEELGARKQAVAASDQPVSAPDQENQA